MTTTFAGHLLTGDHASRPAATAVPAGTLHSCTDHSLIYQSDGSAWSTWATVGGGGGGSSALTGAKVIRNGTQSLTASAVTAISFGVEVFDTDAFHDTATNPERFTVPAGLAGKYQFVGGGKISVTNVDVQVQFRKNGAAYIPAAGGPSGGGWVNLDVIDVLAVGDYVELTAYPGSVSATFGFADTNPDNQAHMSIVYLGA